MAACGGNPARTGRRSHLRECDLAQAEVYRPQGINPCGRRVSLMC
jgi:hypothetical protein